MPDMSFVGWIVVGFLAGALSAGVVGRRSGPRGCLADTAIGVLGGYLGGWFATHELGYGQTQGFFAALIVAFLGAVVIRLLLNAIEGDQRRGRW